MFLLRKRLTKKEDNLSGMARSQGNWSHLTLSHFWGEKKKKLQLEFSLSGSLRLISFCAFPVALSAAC